MTQLTPIDPITTEIIRNAFMAAAEDMRATLWRSAFSPVIYEMKDCSVALFDEKAQLLAQAPGLPFFLGALSEVVQVVIDQVGLAELMGATCLSSMILPDRLSPE
ncbi:MAG: hydantoinase B/oxoprolinase family protein [Anaerolineae bacterium]